MFKMEFTTDNAAFHDPETGDENEFFEELEILRIMELVSIAVRDGEKSGTIMDITGNHIGRWEKS